MDNIIPQDPPQFKQCYACKQNKPATPEFFVRNKRYADGLNYRCKECYKEYLKADHTREVLPEGGKRCTKCKNVFHSTLEFFYKNSCIKSGLSSSCKKCMRTQGKVYDDTHKEDIKRRYQENKEQISVRQKRFREDHQEALSQKQRMFRATHQEHMRNRDRRKYERNRDAVLERAKIYRKTHQDERKAWEHKRRAQKKEAGGAFTPQDITCQLKRQHNRCYYCKAKFAKSPGSYHIDHVIPLAKGGSNDPSNLVLACPSCNCSKQSKFLHEWPQGGRLC